MPSLRRVVVALAIVLVIGVFVTQWILPVRMSFQAARKPPTLSWLVPRELPDLSISTAPGTKLSYFGYEFEVPWTDLDDTQTRSYPHMVLLTFHSGLKLMAGASPGKLWLNGLFGNSEITQARVEQTFGIHSDYDFLKTLYTFTPDKIHVWSLSPRLHYRETYMLELKSVALSREAETGLFYVSNPMYKGFQVGDPQAWLSDYRPKSKSTIFLQLFSDREDVSLTLLQNDFKNPAGISQADINRIVQTIHKLPGDIARTNTSSP